MSAARLFCSTIIPTIGRPSVARSVRSVLDQSLTAGDFEVIVVNDSGQPLPAGDWQGSPRVRQIETSGRRGQSVARNAGAAIARGRYLHFLDDDDWLLPNALAAFWELSQRAPRADWLYGGLRLVNGAGQTLGEFNPGLDGNIHTQLMAGAWVTPVASLIRTEAFVAAQGYEPSLSICEETDLGRRLTHSGDAAHTAAVVACVLRGDGAHTSTVNGPDAPEINRWSRDRALAAPGTFGRLLRSAHSAYWRGRVLQAYLAAARWNWRRGQYAASARRAGCALLSLALAGPSLLSGAYWQALADEHARLSALKVIGAYENGPQAVSLPERIDHG
jgi:glycosyltransferase involved in cell wall biosynthesis